MGAFLTALKRLVQGPPRMPVAARGSMADLRTYVERLLQSPGYGTLIVQVVNSEAFVQFASNRGQVEIDFPLITPTQQGREDRIRRFVEDKHLKVRSTFGSNGGRFIDVDLPIDPAQVTAITVAVFDDIFGVRDPVQLEFSGEGWGVAA